MRERFMICQDVEIASFQKEMKMTNGKVDGKQLPTESAVFDFGRLKTS